MKNDFKKKVYGITRKIPKGFVATYGQIAKLGGRPKAARAVGAYMRINPDAPNTPCHRVVSTNGKLTGYSGAGGLRGKKKMLLAEGVHFKGDSVDLSKSLWKTA